MKTNAKTAEKRTAVDYLSFGAKTARRVNWEAFEFTIIGPHLVQVTNASYGFEKDDHSYTVGVKERDGLVLPAECDCPADLHYESDCKHKVALASIGSIVLAAAPTFSPQSTPSGKAEATTMVEKLQSDGGTATEDTEPETCPNGDPHCDGPGDDDLSCFACFDRGGD
jgi:hypothetical protein